MKPFPLLFLLSLPFLFGCQPAAESTETPESEGWISLFNGEDLTGWTPKLQGYEVGENYGETFRVEDGLLKVSYAQYDSFGQRFGHLFYQTPYSRYRIRLEYRFEGDQCPGGPGWATRNSGIMVHGQDPATMSIDQSFPVCIEVQLLGGNGEDERATGNLCTPGTHVVMGDSLHKAHCTTSSSPTFHGEQWVQAEVYVDGHRKIRHLINGEVVLQYTDTQLDPDDPEAQALLAAGADTLLSRGTISLQSESHPVAFRRIELLPLGE